MISHNSSKKVLVEVCVDTLSSARSAQNGGASRIELCSALSEGGLTPSAGIIAKARQLFASHIYVMIRPRTGNFIYSEDEVDAMIQDISLAKQLGANGIVSGILNSDGSVHIPHTSKLVKAASPLPFTFHRAFDLTPDPNKALEDIICCGCTRILTSGQKPTAIEGKELIHELIRQAGTRIIIMPGSGVNEHNVAMLISATNAVEVHLSARNKLKTKLRDTKMCADEPSFHQMYETDSEIVHAVISKANSILQ